AESMNRCLEVLDTGASRGIRCSNGATMRKRGMVVALAGTIILASTALLFAGKAATLLADETLCPTNGWAIASPASVGLDERVPLKLDKDMASGTYSQMMDSFAIFRCGKKVFE